VIVSPLSVASVTFTANETFEFAVFFGYITLCLRTLQNAVSPTSFLTGFHSAESKLEVYVVAFAAPTGNTSTPLSPLSE